MIITPDTTFKVSDVYFWICFSAYKVQTIGLILNFSPKSKTQSFAYINIPQI